LGNVPGEDLLNVSRNAASSSRLPILERCLAAAPEAGYVGQEEVTVARLDDELERLAIRAERPFLKLDVQGCETEVIAGAQAFMNRVIGIQIELSFVPLYDGGVLYDEALIALRKAGFVPVGIDPGFRDEEGALLQADMILTRSEGTHVDE
jgi:hypothetical protein